jgi:hypothetical protein
MAGGEDSPLTLSPLLLGGVLNGEMSAASDVASGARFARAEGSAESDFGGILGLPARFTGGGTGGAEDTGRSPFRGSLAGPLPVCVGNIGFASIAGVPLRLGILRNLFPLEADEGESNAACAVGRSGWGECMGDVEDFGGDLGDWTVTFGGDLVGDLGGEKAIIDVGLCFGVPHSDCPRVFERGVTVPLPL